MGEVNICWGSLPMRRCRILSGDSVVVVDKDAVEWIVPIGYVALGNFSAEDNLIVVSTSSCYSANRELAAPFIRICLWRLLRSHYCPSNSYR